LVARLASAYATKRSDRLVAIKTILSQYATDLRFSTNVFGRGAYRFRDFPSQCHGKSMTLANHGHWLFLVMEWVDGESLTKLFRAREQSGAHMPPGIVARILADACAGLHAAHELTEKND